MMSYSILTYKSTDPLEEKETFRYQKTGHVGFHICNHWGAARNRCSGTSLFFFSRRLFVLGAMGLPMILGPWLGNDFGIGCDFLPKKSVEHSIKTLIV